jgi:hypothetical protein
MKKSLSNIFLMLNTMGHSIITRASHGASFEKKIKVLTFVRAEIFAK